MANQIARIIQISDMHLFANTKDDLLGVKTAESLAEVVKCISKDGACDAILLTGDLSQDSSKVAYRSLAEVVGSLKAPAYWVPGNHDDPRILEQVYPLGTIKNDKHILFDHWQFILLNSHADGAVHGFLDDKELTFLENCLKKYPKHKAIIVFHHQPTSVGTKWLDNLGIHNADIFWQRLKKYSNVYAILFGHIHQSFEEKINNVYCYAAPSTCIQFKRQADFGLEKLPPGYRWLELYDDGQLKTGVVRIKHYVGRFDHEATGY